MKLNKKAVFKAIWFIVIAVIGDLFIRFKLPIKETELAIEQMNSNSGAYMQLAKVSHLANYYWVAVVVLGLLVFSKEIVTFIKSKMNKQKEN